MLDDLILIKNKLFLVLTSRDEKKKKKRKKNKSKISFFTSLGQAKQSTRRGSPTRLKTPNRGWLRSAPRGEVINTCDMLGSHNINITPYAIITLKK